MLELFSRRKSDIYHSFFDGCDGSTVMDHGRKREDGNLNAAVEVDVGRRLSDVETLGKGFEKGIPMKASRVSNCSVVVVEETLETHLSGGFYLANSAKQA